MTGRELIIYILSNNLEDKPVVLPDGFLDLLTVEQAAVKFEVGVETIKVWFFRRYLDGVRIGEDVYILPNAEPRLDFEASDDRLCKHYLEIFNGK